MPTADKSTDITIRQRPTQARSRETFEKILNAAAELLDEVGYEGFNTNALADQAGVKVAAIYRYFPNKLSVISTLADQMVAEWDSWMEDFDENLEKSGNFKETWGYYIDLYVKSIKDLPGGLSIRRAMQATPELHKIDQEDNVRLAERLAKSLMRYCPEISKVEAKNASIVLMESVVPILDLALVATPRKSKQLIDALKDMHFSYFDKLFSGRKTRSSSTQGRKKQE